MRAVVEHASGDGGKSSMTEQTDDGIASCRHDFGSILAMDRAFVLPQSHLFDVMEAVFNRPMSSFQLEQVLRIGDRGRQTGDPVAYRLFPDPFGLKAAADLKYLL
ncbi:MAG: hypothetical protein NVS4B12_22020 [Ktedonobacteraceae bacterium]